MDYSNVPVNPLGRTGVIGPGILPKLGENKIDFFIIISYKPR